MLCSSLFRERLEENEQQNLAIMLMVVVLIFVICNALAMIANILDMLNFNAASLTKVSWLASAWDSQFALICCTNLQISNLLVTLNSSVNLFIYCGFGRKFRRELKKLFGLNGTAPQVSAYCASSDSNNKRKIAFLAASYGC